MSISIKRIYDDPAPSDGYRVLVDRLWPRGVSKDAAALDEWAKDAAPSSDLRAWFHEDMTRFDVFAKKYRDELDAGGAQPMIDRVRAGYTVTLIYASANAEQNHAIVLRDYINEKAGS